MVKTVFEVVAETLKVDPSEVTSKTGPGDLPQWDSLGHIAVITAVEDAFGLSLDITERLEIESVADLEDLVNDA